MQVLHSLKPSYSNRSSCISEDHKPNHWSYRTVESTRLWRSQSMVGEEISWNVDKRFWYATTNTMIELHPSVPNSSFISTTHFGSLSKERMHSIYYVINARSLLWTNSHLASCLATEKNKNWSFIGKKERLPVFQIPRNPHHTMLCAIVLTCIATSSEARSDNHKRLEAIRWMTCDHPIWSVRSKCTSSVLPTELGEDGKGGGCDFLLLTFE